MKSKTVIVYASAHHSNTRKLAEAIARHDDVELVDVIANERYDLSGYDLIGVASGIVYGKYYPQMLKFLESNLPENKDVFFVHTAGDPRQKHAEGAKSIAQRKNCRCLGVYYCKGFDTYGPFKIIGGINKSHPDEADINGAVRFYEGLRTNMG